jgi:hypothetical protein
MKAAIILLLIIFLGMMTQEAEDLANLLKTDNGGQGPTLQSQMFLAATHGYIVAADGTVKLQDGTIWRLWPELEIIA